MIPVLLGVLLVPWFWTAATFSAAYGWPLGFAISTGIFAACIFVGYLWGLPPRPPKDK